MLEENRIEEPFIESNPEIIFLERRKELYVNEIYLLRNLLEDENLELINKFFNLISQCQRKIDIISAYQISQATNISLKAAMKLTKTTD